MRAAVSYALPGKEGNLYRFDGWKFYGSCKPWAGTGTWSNPSRANDIDDGVKKLYYYEYPSAASDIAALLARAGFDSGRKSRKARRAGFIVTSSAPGSVRVRYHSTVRTAATDRHKTLTAYARTVQAAGFGVTTDGDLHELIVTAEPSGRGACR